MSSASVPESEELTRGPYMRIHLLRWMELGKPVRHESGDETRRDEMRRPSPPALFPLLLLFLLDYPFCHRTNRWMVGLLIFVRCISRAARMPHC
ncbi:hypothetical protein BDW42DRAFT_174541 [Aspergillus taichungensis]|uniref:Uncharacterized protein n=1 Tax=Aspergillus taichungensis TaxID=482145 RepID=A0A2J5HMY9_9EURO|nr:hypothetical protein BDW42DRAFT_174541 [Aspergillus taichungensis]